MFNIKKQMIMKKTYINPEMAIVRLQTMQMLAASENLGGDRGDYNSGTVTTGGRDYDLDFDED